MASKPETAFHYGHQPNGDEKPRGHFGTPKMKIG